MSRISELRSNPNNSINIVDVLSLLCPEGKSKYVETLLRIMRSTENLAEVKKETIEALKDDYKIPANMLSDFDAIQIIHIKKFLDDMFELSDIQSFQKFCGFNERNMIEDNDLSQYKSFERIEAAVNVADLKECEKEMELQILRIFENEEWLILRPLTFEASKKYGSNTKWCTTMERDADHFERYGKGILIYTINKKNNLKVAAYKALDNTEFSFWNATDERVDSLDTQLSPEVLNLIKQEVETNKVGNTSLAATNKKSK